MSEIKWMTQGPQNRVPCEVTDIESKFWTMINSDDAVKRVIRYTLVTYGSITVHLRRKYSYIRCMYGPYTIVVTNHLGNFIFGSLLISTLKC